MSPTNLTFRTLEDVRWANKTALLRADFNVPLQNGECADDSRIRAVLPTIRHILANGGGVLCLSHLGRPQPGTPDPAWSLAPVAKRLHILLGREIKFCRDWPTARPASGEVWLLENTRFNIGEKENAAALAAKYASLGDVFVLDAFAAAHRAEASTCALAAAAAECCAGKLLQQETQALQQALFHPSRPITAIIGGAKVSTKLTVLGKLLTLCDYLIVGGGIANTFLLAQGHPIGRSLAEADLRDKARELLSCHGQKILLPKDVVVSDSDGVRQLSLAELSAIGSGRILDVGKKTLHNYERIIMASGTVIWNGPLGLFEESPFDAGTRALANFIVSSSAYSLAGGGDTLAAVSHFGAAAGISYLSTGGGAFLEFLEGAELPALTALAAASAKHKR